MSTDPVRMQTSSGWSDISTDLVRTTVDGVSVLKPENVPVDITVGTGGSNRIASLDDKNGHSLTQSWPFGTLPEPVVAGNSATYRQVLPGVDLIQLAHNTGISQVLKIETAEAAKDPRVAEMRIFMDSQNTVVEQNADGDLTAKGTDSGEVELRNTGGLWWDSSAQGATATDPGGQGVARPFSLTLGTEAGKQSQIFGMDEILDSADLTFPVFVDPDWTTTRANYVFVDSAYPGTSYWNGNLTNGQGHVGFLPSNWAPDGMSHLTRTYFQFNTSYLVGRDILAARLNTVETWSSSCTPTNVASWITGDIGPATNWNVQPNLIVRTDMGAVAKGYNASCPAGTVGFDLMAGKYAFANRTVLNVMLAAGNESDPLGWKKFENSATLTVTHNVPPNTPVIGTITGGKYAYPSNAPAYYVTRNSKPVFRVSDSDPDGAVGGPIQVFMEVYTETGVLVRGSGGISGAAAGDVYDWQIDVNLANGRYYLQAQSKDMWGAYSGTMRFNFRVDTTPPAAPRITQVPTAQAPATLTEDTHEDADGVIGETIYNFHLELPAGSDPAEGFVFSIISGSAPASAYPMSIRCGDPRIQEYVAVCPAGGMSADIRIAALDETTVLTVWAFDSAGNVSVPLHNANGSTYAFTVGMGSVRPTTFVNLQLNGQTQWVTPQPGGDNTCGQIPFGDISPGGEPQMLTFTNGTSTAQTPGRVIDPSKSFSVSGWFCPTSATGTTVQDLITQWTSTGPAAALRGRTDGKPELVAWTGTGTTETVIGQDLVSGRWAYVSAIYDKINAQLRITKTDTNGTGNWIKAASPVAHKTAALSDAVKLGGGFVGNIYKPMLTQGVLKPTTFKDANQYSFTSTSKGLLK